MKDPELIYYGIVKDGQISLPKRMRAELVRFFDGPIEVRIRRKRSRRSLPQNAYYWSACVPAILEAFRDWDSETGWTAEMVHEVLKGRFLPKVREWGQVVVPDTGEVIEEVPSTRKLTVSEFSDYVAHVQKWAAEMNIIIPEANEQAELYFVNP